EWNYAAAGGGEQRQYPWGSAIVDASHAVYGCTGDGSAVKDCAFADILKVGSKPAGDGKYGQGDLTGRRWGVKLDGDASLYVTPCNNCANLQSASSRVIRGGSWLDSLSSDLLSSSRVDYNPTTRYPELGARCARNL